MYRETSRENAVSWASELQSCYHPRLEGSGEGELPEPRDKSFLTAPGTFVQLKVTSGQLGPCQERRSRPASAFDLQLAKPNQEQRARGIVGSLCSQVAGW